MTKEQIVKILSRAFDTLEVDPATGEPVRVIIEGKPVSTGRHFLADHELQALVEQIND